MPTEYYGVYGFAGIDYSYDANTVIVIRNQTQFTPPVFFIGNGESSYFYGVITSGSGINSILAAFSTSANYPLVMFNQTADDTNGGNGTLDLWINYFVIDTLGNIQP